MVGLGNPSRDRQTEAGARAAAGRIELNEAIEDARLVARRDAGSRIGYADRDPPASLAMSIETTPPGGVCCTAFCRTFSTSCRSRSSSPRNEMSGQLPARIVTWRSVDSA